MCDQICTGVASSTLFEIIKCVWSKATSNINYLLCYHREVEKFKQLVQELDKKKEDIQQEVDAARRNGRTVDADVSQWLAKLNDVIEDAMRLEEQVKRVRRFMGCCWNCFSGYKIGKEVAEKIDTAKELLNTKFTIYSHEPPPPSIVSLFPNRDFQELLSTKSSMDHIWEALNKQNFNIIGVYGMGGVGKTTVIKEVAKRAKNVGQYKEMIMVTVSQNQDDKKIQTEIAEQLGLHLTDESKIVRGAKLLDRIKGAGKILIILDDLWDFLNIGEIGIPSADENKECKVVITTRSRDVCCDMECQKHIKVEPLSEKESWDLFKLKVGDVVEKNDNLKELAMDVAKECGGLPLAIVTLGRAMREKDDISTWKSVRNELRQSVQTRIRGMEDSVFKCIRRSFDFLRSDEAKLCFLLCSLFPEDWEIYIVDFFRYVVGEGILRDVYSMEEAWDIVRRLLDELKDCCLLLEGEGEDSEHFKMHDVVRDVAIWISSDKTYGFYGFANKGLRRWPDIARADECQRIFFTGNYFDSLPAEQLVFPKLRTLILKESRISTIPDGFFQRMEALFVLDLRSERVASLPSSFPCLVNLKALFLSGSRGQEDFDVGSLSLIGELKKLEILQLEGFEFGTVPKEFGNLTRLRCLDLLYCRGTIPRNLISRLCRLEQLYLTWQVVDDEGSSSSGDSTGGCGGATFAELASLSCLTTLHVDIQNPDHVFLQQEEDDLNIDPWQVFLQQEEDDLNFVPWQALTDFQIFLGARFGLGPSRRRKGKQLAITKSTYKYKWVSDLVTKTERLCLHNWSGMECLFGGAEEEEEGFTVGHKLFEVEALYLHSMPDMRSLCKAGTTLPNGVLLRKLSELVIRDCHKLIDVLPTCMLLRTHQLMERLEIRRCDKLEKVLSLNFVQEEGGQSAAAGIVLLPRLESIELEDLPELRSVWDIDGVIMLAPGSLQNLQRLEVFRCKSLKDDNILPPILPIPNKLDHFPSLKRMFIDGCDSLTYLLSWRQAKGLPHLQELYVENCERMETVIFKEEEEEEEEGGQSAAAGIVLLPRLESIHLSNLPELRSVWDIDGGVIMLAPGSLQNLQSLTIRRCKSLKDDNILPPILPIPNKLDHFPSLQRMEIRGCDSLTYLLSWRQAKGLPHLQFLTVHSCERMETVIFKEEEGGQSAAAGIVLLPRLETLVLEDLPELRSVWDIDGVTMLAPGSLQNLQSLTVDGCKSLKDDNILPPILPSLRELFIWGCDSLTYLLSWRQAKGLPHLQKLTVVNCERMETLVVIKEEEEEEERHDVLPSLTELWLENLPMLRSCFLKGGEQCSSNSPLISSFKSLKGLWVKKCPELKKLQPLSSSSSSPINLQYFRGDSWEWFESLEWGDQDQSIKERLRAVFQPMQSYSKDSEMDVSDEKEELEDEDESDSENEEVEDEDNLENEDESEYEED